MTAWNLVGEDTAAERTLTLNLDVDSNGSVTGNMNWSGAPNGQPQFGGDVQGSQLRLGSTTAVGGKVTVGIPPAMVVMVEITVVWIDVADGKITANLVLNGHPIAKLDVHEA